MSDIISIIHSEECPSCGGTGLYVGMGERDGYAVVCHTCKGTGEYKFRREYVPFKSKKPPPAGVDTVLQVNPGIQTGKRSGVARFGGLPIEDWAKGKPFKRGTEMRNFTCPAGWCQAAGYGKWRLFEECTWVLGGYFSDCKKFGEKHLCWQRFDDESDNSITE